jgi:glycosyltransferase involved in cell wall biosynthesis
VSGPTAPTSPEISVVIPCHDCADVLPLQLEALATQSDAPTFEVIVVDNRSADGLRGVVEQWRRRLPRLRYVEGHASWGASYARNVGIGASQAPYLMFCDADDVVSRWWLSHGRRNFDVTGLWTGSLIPVVNSEFPTTVRAARDVMGDCADWTPPVDDQRGAFPVLTGGNFGVSRCVLEAIVGFDQSLPPAGEDNDLAFRALRSGHRIPVSSTARVAYRLRDDPRMRRRLVFRAAVAHALIASRYDAWDASPHPRWLVGLVRCAGAGMLMCAFKERRDWDALAERACSACGIAVGTFRYGRWRTLPPAQIGHGIGDGSA